MAIKLQLKYMKKHMNTNWKLQKSKIKFSWVKETTDKIFRLVYKVANKN